MRIGVVGCGYVGLVAAAGFASVGHDVVAVDRDAARVARLRDGACPLCEPGLDDLLRAGREAGRLGFASGAEALAGVEVAVLAVGTPSRAGRLDTTALVQAADEVARVAHDAVLVVKSTAPPGTRAMLAGRTGLEVVSNPEFLREGRAVDDFLRPDRVVIGAEGPRGLRAARGLYAGWVPDERVQVVRPVDAELGKLAANGMLAARLAVVNEIARLCEATGADVDAVLGVVGSDPRIGAAYLAPGPGFGGSCLPKDVRALRGLGDVPVLGAVGDANRDQTAWLVGRLREALGGLAGRRIALWGLAFKAGTDDVRDSPALALAGVLCDEGAEVTAHDPAAMDGARRALGQRVRWATGPLGALFGAEALVLATAWPVYANLPPSRIAAAMRGDLVFDARNALVPSAVRAAGLRYLGVGRAAP